MEFFIYNDELILEYAPYTDRFVPSSTKIINQSEYISNDTFYDYLQLVDSYAIHKIFSVSKDNIRIIEEKGYEETYYLAIGKINDGFIS